MKTLVLFAMILMMYTASAVGGLKDLIQQNINAADKSYEQRVSPVEEQKEAVRLWIHLRSEAQKSLGAAIFSAISDTRLRGLHVEQKPLQVVTFGPEQTQLRFFRKEDTAQAQALFDVLRPLVPRLELKDLSQRYQRVRWIKAGHFELWLSPDLSALNVPE